MCSVFRFRRLSVLCEGYYQCLCSSQQRVCCFCISQQKFQKMLFIANLFSPSLCAPHTHTSLGKSVSFTNGILPPLLVLILNNSSSSPKLKTVVVTHPEGEDSQQSLFCTSPNVSLFFILALRILCSLIKKCGE